MATVNSKILIGNLSTDAEEDQIRVVFTGTAGVVSAVSIPKDPKTGKSRGYGFVEMSSDAEAEQAVQDLNGQTINGRKIAMSLVESTNKKKTRKWYQFGPG
jgi:cold-inducible RNA-binding protein